MLTTTVEDEKNGGAQGRQSTTALTTTLNIIFNGTMVFGFDKGKVKVIAPNIPHQGHIYKINEEEFPGKHLDISMTGDPGEQTDWNTIVDRGRVMVFHQSETGGMPKAGNKDATITLPYPNHILPLRSLNMEFDPPAGNGTWAGAVVFVYTGVTQGSIVIAGSNCTVRNPMQNYSELYVLASLPPHHKDDPDDSHSIMSWDAIANLIHKGWQWKKGKEVDPQLKRMPGMDRDIDELPFPIQRPGKEGGGPSCKVPIVVVTYR
jgi:hypothetical protein